MKIVRKLGRSLNSILYFLFPLIIALFIFVSLYTLIPGSTTYDGASCRSLAQLLVEQPEIKNPDTKSPPEVDPKKRYVNENNRSAIETSIYNFEFLTQELQFIINLANEPDYADTVNQDHKANCLEQSKDSGVFFQWLILFVILVTAFIIWRRHRPHRYGRVTTSIYLAIGLIGITTGLYFLVSDNEISDTTRAGNRIQCTTLPFVEPVQDLKGIFLSPNLQFDEEYTDQTLENKLQDIENKRVEQFTPMQGWDENENKKILTANEIDWSTNENQIERLTKAIEQSRIAFNESLISPIDKVTFENLVENIEDGKGDSCIERNNILGSLIIASLFVFLFGLIFFVKDFRSRRKQQYKNETVSKISELTSDDDR